MNEQTTNDPSSPTPEAPAGGVGCSGLETGREYAEHLGEILLLSKARIDPKPFCRDFFKVLRMGRPKKAH